MWKSCVPLIVKNIYFCYQNNRTCDFVFRTIHTATYIASGLSILSVSIVQSSDSDAIYP